MGPLITVAHEAIAVSDPHTTASQLTCTTTPPTRWARTARHTMSRRRVVEQGLDAAPPEQNTLSPSDMNTRAVDALRHGPD